MSHFYLNSAFLGVFKDKLGHTEVKNESLLRGIHTIVTIGYSPSFYAVHEIVNRNRKESLSPQHCLILINDYYTI